MTTEKKRAVLALAILVPLPSIGTASALVLWPGTALGVAIFSVSKVLLLALPFLWHRFVEGRPLERPRPRRRGMAWGLASGVLIAGGIALAYFAMAPALLDRERVRASASAAGFGSRGMFIAGAIYWTFANALLEEYVWRWFVTGQFGSLVGRTGAVAASAAAFTCHHVIALAVYMPAPAAAVCSLGVAVGGATWSLLYLKYRSVWPGYASHILADVAVFAAGYALVFG
ncbi:MAG: CPBP family intramembrane glutamic endopeptidase [Planctomycetota bacterium]|jgi:membrane protease YdiL (CAAX protease family)